MSSESPEEGDFDDAALFGEDSVSDDSPASDDAVAEVTPAAVPAAATAAAGHYTVGEHPAIIFCDECGNIMKPEVICFNIGIVTRTIFIIIKFNACYKSCTLLIFPGVSKTSQRKDKEGDQVQMS